MGRANNHRPRRGKEPPMRNSAKSREAKQAGGGLLLTAQQLLLPMIEGMARSKQALLEWVQQVGLSALGELFERDAEQLAGPKGKHSKERSHYRWGSAPAELPFGGRRIVVNRPRVRNIVGGEEQLPTVEHFQHRVKMDRIDALVNWRRTSNAVGYGSMSSPAEHSSKDHEVGSKSSAELKPTARVGSAR